MRICFIAHGGFTHIDAYLDYFRHHGHEVHFVALVPGPTREVPTYNVGLNQGLLKLLGKSSYMPAMLRARRVVRSLAPDIVHAHYATSAGLAAFICSVHPYMVTAHGDDVAQGVKSIVWRSVLRRIFEDADCVNPVSDDLQELVLGLGIRLPKVETLTLGIDTKRFGFQELLPMDASAPLRLLCTRRLEPTYDHATIIRSMAFLKGRGLGFELMLVGDGPCRKDLETLASQLNVRDQITFAGQVPNEMLPKYLANCDIYLSASTADGTSLCLLEAMSSGLYPVVSDIKANRAWINHGENGLLHRVSDPLNLADCIALSPHQVREGAFVLSRNRELVVRLADRNTNMKRLEQIYQRLIRPKQMLH